LLPASTPLPVIWQRRDIAGDPYRVGSGGLWRSGRGASSLGFAAGEADRLHGGGGTLRLCAWQVRKDF
jgi:hypothetical protein